MKYSDIISGLSDRAFWDVNFENLNPETNKEFIITRVFDRGNWDDVMAVILFYGKKEVIKILLSAEYLMQHAINLAIGLFHLNSEDFTCFTRKQFHPVS